MVQNFHADGKGFERIGSGFAAQTPRDQVTGVVTCERFLGKGQVVRWIGQVAKRFGSMVQLYKLFILLVPWGFCASSFFSHNGLKVQVFHWVAWISQMAARWTRGNLTFTFIRNVASCSYGRFGCQNVPFARDVFCISTFKKCNIIFHF